MAIQTLAMRKRAAVDALVAGLEALRPVLVAHARALGGRYVLYGSAARGELRHDSDVDLLLDFADDASTTAAWRAAERACSALGVPHDIRPLGMCDAAFLEHVLPSGVVLG